MEKNTINKMGFLRVILQDLQANKDNKFNFGSGNTIIVKNNSESEHSEILISIENYKITIKEKNNKFKFTCSENSILIEYADYIKVQITNSENYCLQFMTKTSNEIFNLTENWLLYSRLNEISEYKNLYYNDGSNDFKVWRDELCNSEAVTNFEEFIIMEIMKYFPNLASFITENVNLYRKSCIPVRKRTVFNN